MKHLANNYLILCTIVVVITVLYVDASNNKRLLNNDKESTKIKVPRKLFGGYKITPKLCIPTISPVRLSSNIKKDETINDSDGPNVCMFNDECTNRNGIVVGACMDGFLFGTCCKLNKDTMIGEFLEKYYQKDHLNENTSIYDIPSNSLSQIAASLLNENNKKNNLPTTLPLITSSSHLPLVVNQNNNRKTTISIDNSTPSTLTMITPVPTIQKLPFSSKPKPIKDDNYVLVPTIPHKDTFNRTATTTELPLSTFSYVTSSSISSKKPIQQSSQPVKFVTTSNKIFTFSPVSTKPSSTSVTSETILFDENNYQSIATPTKPSVQHSHTTVKPPSTSYVYSSTFRPTGKPSVHYSSIKQPSSYLSTSSSRPTQFISTHDSPTPTYIYSTYRPSITTTSATSTTSTTTTKTPSSQSTNYLPPSPIVQSSSVGPGFTVTTRPINGQSQYSPASTVIVLGSSNEQNDDEQIASVLSSRPPLVTQPPLPPLRLPQKKPVNLVTINNHVVQNIYSTERPSSPISSLPSVAASPTVLITPKPTSTTVTTSASSVPPTSVVTDENDLESVVVTSTNDLFNNFPPDRNPNITRFDVTTPGFIEDDAMKDKIESFVNQIIYGLQGPFDDLNSVINTRKNGTTTIVSSSSTTRKPSVVTTKTPAAAAAALYTSNVGTTRSTTKKPATVTKITKKPVPTTKYSKRPSSVTPIKKITTPPTTLAPQNFIDNNNDEISLRNACGTRPLVKSGRIVGGKGATFGEFPWQVLVRESTWLGLFTKNKCGGVLISDKYVMTAAHCQPAIFASLIAVFGEFDISGNLENRKPVSRNVKRVIVHRKYDPDTFENDLALLELESPVKFDSHIIPICLPHDHEDFTGRMATVTGWGRLKYGGAVPYVLQEVQVPIMENNICQDMYRTAGHSKIILPSFLCAGYTTGEKDSCEGDSGGPLVLQRPDGHYELVGTVSHGIKCAAPYLPGVYMRTTYYKDWITGITGLQ